MTDDVSDAERLQRDLDELREAVLNDWILITSRAGDALRAFQNTFSWRITRPLRVVRRFGYQAREIGFVPASQLAAARLASTLGSRR